MISFGLTYQQSLAIVETSPHIEQDMPARWVEHLEKVRMFRKTVKSLGERFACLNRETSQTSDPTIIDLVNQLRTRGFVVLDHLVGSSDIIELKGKLDKKIEQELI